MAYQSRIWSYSQGDPCRWTCCKGHRIVRIAFLRSFVLWRIIFWLFCSGVHRNRISVSGSHRLRHHCIWRNQYRYRISWSAFYRLFLVWSSSKRQIFRHGGSRQSTYRIGEYQSDRKYLSKNWRTHKKRNINGRETIGRECPIIFIVGKGDCKTVFLRLRAKKTSQKAKWAAALPSARLLPVYVVCLCVIDKRKVQLFS